MKDKIVDVLVYPDSIGSTNSAHEDSWRPENWRNPYCDDYPQRSMDYEAGADAMLKAMHRKSEQVTVEILALLRDEIQKSLLTDVGGHDLDKANSDLQAHKLPSIFSYRQAYFVGCGAQLYMIMDRLKEER